MGGKTMICEHAHDLAAWRLLRIRLDCIFNSGASDKHGRLGLKITTIGI